MGEDSSGVKKDIVSFLVEGTEENKEVLYLVKVPILCPENKVIQKITDLNKYSISEKFDRKIDWKGFWLNNGILFHFINERAVLRVQDKTILQANLNISELINWAQKENTKLSTILLLKMIRDTPQYPHFFQNYLKVYEYVAFLDQYVFWMIYFSFTAEMLQDDDFAMSQIK